MAKFKNGNFVFTADDTFGVRAGESNAKKVSLREVMEGNVFCAEVLAVVDHFAALAADTQAEFGPRCPDFDADCPTCKAWASYDVKARRVNRL